MITIFLASEINKINGKISKVDSLLANKLPTVATTSGHDMNDEHMDIEYIIDQKPHCTPFLNIFVSAIFALWITNCAR
jgi:hypothetical protein